jgi:hypothetical protein
VCSITVNSIVEQQLINLERSNNRELIEKKLYRFATEASPSTPGALDIPGMYGMPSKLQKIRKKRIGRHRIFYTGHHTQCRYHVVFIKEFKKTGVNDENDSRFQRILIGALIDQPIRQLLTPDNSPGLSESDSINP